MRKDIKYLAQKFKESTLSAEELQQLGELLEKEESDAKLEEMFSYPLNDAAAPEVTATEVSGSFSRLQRDPRIVVEKLILRKTNATRILYAASTVGVACLALFITWTFLSSPIKETDKAKPLFTKSSERIQPGGPKAKIVLANGRQLDLEKLKNDTTIRMQGYAIVKSKEGVIRYVPGEGTASATVYNTIITPAGGEYQLQLADGTRIRINAASELRYPITFDGNSRAVTLKGEAFFEVAKFKNNGKNIPFTVQTGAQKIEVLGTSFNVNNYDKHIKTTLIEGAIRLRYNNSVESRVLKPDEQAVYNQGSEELIIKTIDPYYTIAWKNGAFAFENTAITEVMQEIARWYNITVSYEEDLSKVYFTGSISKYEDISKLLSVIALTGSAKFKIEGRRVLVMR